MLLVYASGQGRREGVKGKILQGPYTMAINVDQRIARGWVASVKQVHVLYLYSEKYSRTDFVEGQRFLLTSSKFEVTKRTDLVEFRATAREVVGG